MARARAGRKAGSKTAGKGGSTASAIAVKSTKRTRKAVQPVPDDVDMSGDEAEATAEAGLSKRDRRNLKRVQFMRHFLAALNDTTMVSVNSSRKAAARHAKRNADPAALYLDPSKLVATRAGREHTLAVEAENMKQVMKHPTFANNGISAIRQHLQNTIRAQRAAAQESDQA
ncbi:uncharacterized protein MONBRDRAFT_11328 [Monosiga brevicollis MX1]|uniref:Ribosome biogenesis protein SLX9 n=1 Tax=Monosiga brevicollis TaxID=81824 RepID=A9V8X0_MONBE|nr:uncharacterized protein MONBRDRAFT_11328 [Monosiga brevicollis MX1]EDQ85948.1 predicted protein [Monosiga brevicollis MX1]|eukprot:XP_001749142.1 hypothetical protein [Monosiga brevicollis MX1]